MLEDSNVEERKEGNKCWTCFRRCVLFIGVTLSMLVLYCVLDNRFLRSVLHKNDDVRIRCRYNMTIISAYFNLGTFRKGSRARSSPNLYRRWAMSLTRMRNPLVFYTDDPSVKFLIENGRRNLSIGTTVIFINNQTRQRMWAFGLHKKIDSIYKDPVYPKHYPSTVNANYTCVQHAKYELVLNAIDRKLYVADYYAWLDVGYFRQIAHSSFRFHLEVPVDFHPDKVAYTQIRPKKPNLTMSGAIRGNQLWLGGGMFIGVEKTLRIFVKQYQKAVSVFLSRGLANTDQQIIYGMFTKNGKQLIKPSVEPQAYVPPKGHNPWFYLGLLCMKKDKVNT